MVRKSAQKRKKISHLETSLKICEEKCNESPTFENQEELEMLNMEYDSIYEQIAKGALFDQKPPGTRKAKKAISTF